MATGRDNDNPDTFWSAVGLGLFVLGAVLSFLGYGRHVHG